jgi:GNAT superfamily N-acetyltransferase
MSAQSTSAPISLRPARPGAALHGLRAGGAAGHDLRVVAAQSADLSWFEELARESLAPYYAAHGLQWHAPSFRASLTGTENYRVDLDGSRAGLLRYSRGTGGLYVHDMHLLPQLRGQGIGTALLRMVEERARRFGAPAVRMRVFGENPALRLYERSGYARTGEEEFLLHMELKLARPG